MKLTVTQESILLDFLMKKIGAASTTRARDWLKAGRVSVDGAQVVNAKTVLNPGQIVEFGQGAVRLGAGAPFVVLFEDDYFIIAEKPAGMLAVDHENPGGPSFFKMVNDYVREKSYRKERAYLVHRLDRYVSGLMIFAKSAEIEKQLENIWPRTEKHYYAIVEGAPPETDGTVRSWLAEDGLYKVYSTSEGLNAKYAVTHYSTKKRSAKNSLLEIRLETGRKNQIRVHMADLGCPILGDEKYGAKGKLAGRVALHAYRFSFVHPVTKERVVAESAMPRGMQRIVEPMRP